MNLVSFCREELQQIAVGDRFRVSAGKTLDAAATVNDRRNQVIHDMWWRHIVLGPNDTSTTPQWHALRGRRRRMNAGVEEPPRDLAFIKNTVTQLNRAICRVDALNWALIEVLP
jgi:hypothetical protein